MSKLDTAARSMTLANDPDDVLKYARSWAKSKLASPDTTKLLNQWSQEIEDAADVPSHLGEVQRNMIAKFFGGASLPKIKQEVIKDIYRAQNRTALRGVEALDRVIEEQRR